LPPYLRHALIEALDAYQTHYTLTASAGNGRGSIMGAGDVLAVDGGAGDDSDAEVGRALADDLDDDNSDAEGPIVTTVAASTTANGRSAVALSGHDAVLRRAAVARHQQRQARISRHFFAEAQERVLSAINLYYWPAFLESQCFASLRDETIRTARIQMTLMQSEMLTI